MDKQLEEAIRHIKTRADAWAVKEVTEALQSISERLNKALSQEPCDDVVSREAVKEIICAEFVDTQDGMSEWRNAVNDVVEEILHKVEHLPSVTQKSGKWIHFAQSDDCSECGWSTGKYISPSNYCPNCGAKMKSEDKE